MSRALLAFTDSETGELTRLIADCYVDSDTICGVLRRADALIDPEMNNTYELNHYQVGGNDVFHITQSSVYPGVGLVKIQIVGFVYKDHAHTDKAELEFF